MRANFLILLCLISAAAFAQDTAQKKPKPWEATEIWEPKVKVVTPGNKNSEPPSDAIILFDGKGLGEWQNPQFKGEPSNADDIEKMLKQWDPNFMHVEAGWIVKDNELIVRPGNGAIETKREFSKIIF